jgi:hypothetical protein
MAGAWQLAAGKTLRLAERLTYPGNVDEYAPARSNYWPGGKDEILGTLANGTKVKVRMLSMRACTEKDAKNKMCRGHLKRWFDQPDEVRQFAGKCAEVYRCERCHTIYLPNVEERPRTQTLAW